MNESKQQSKYELKSERTLFLFIHLNVCLFVCSLSWPLNEILVYLSTILFSLKSECKKTKVF